MKIGRILSVSAVVMLVAILLAGCTADGELLPELRGPVSIFIQSLVELLLIPLLVMGISWVYAQARIAWATLTETNPDDAYWISFVVKNVVLAAEQMAKAHPDEISDKRQWAIDQAEAWFDKYGIDVGVEQIIVMIEAEVKALFNSPPVLPD